MTIDLYRADDDTFQLEYFGIWQKVLELARLYGWEPVGTLQPPEWESPESGDPWAGRYDMYLGERVSDTDASAMANALERALDDLPDHTMPDRIIETEIEEIDQENQISISFYIIEPNPELNLFEAFGGQYKDSLKALISFCKKGGYHIYSVRDQLF